MVCVNEIQFNKETRLPKSSWTLLFTCKSITAYINREINYNYSNLKKRNLENVQNAFYVGEIQAKIFYLKKCFLLSVHCNLLINIQHDERSINVVLQT